MALFKKKKKVETKKAMVKIPKGVEIVNEIPEGIGLDDEVDDDELDDEVTEEVEEQAEEEVVKPKRKAAKPITPEPQVTQVPVILSRQDFDRMIYENNMMLRKILSELDNTEEGQ